MWPIVHWKLQNNLAKYYHISQDTKVRVLYRYAFGEIKDTGSILFAFDIGCERYVIIINEKYPDSSKLSAEFISNIFDDVEGLPNLFYYLSLN